MTHPLYSSDFYAQHEDKSRLSARATIPFILQYVQPATVVDVGCGVGVWLAEFQAAGITDVTGLDGPWVDVSQLRIDRSRFMACDLTRPLPMDRKFDLAISMEVAEHLPAAAASDFVASLCRLAPVVVFSAAFPLQGGHGHVNEQYPEYWRDRFLDQDYVVVDALRRHVWHNEQIEPWYRQNILFFVHRGQLARYPKLAEVFAVDGDDRPLSFVHPSIFRSHCEFLSRQLHQAQCESMHSAMRLREINLAIFPDWTQAVELVSGQIFEVLTGLMQRADVARIALVVRLGGADVDAAGKTLGSLVERHVASKSHPQGALHVVAVSDGFPEERWKVLASCLQGRVALGGEDRQAIAMAGAESLAVISLASLQSGRSE